MTPERTEKLLKVLHRRQPDLTLIADQVNKPRNLSALIRNCDAVGIHSVHTVVPKEGYRTYRGTAKGSDFYVKTRQHHDVVSAIETVKAQGMKVVAAHFSDRAIDYRDFDYTQPCAVLMGAEKQGVSDIASDMADAHVTIPMMGMVSSLNVSTAAGIILVEAQHQRLQAGLYDQPRLEQKEMCRCLFEWGNRDLAKFCRDNGLAYPPLDEIGDVIDAPGWYQSVRDGKATSFDWSEQAV
ncbi:tRNA (guanosine(18)-2'-O)-methyltransferase TrmH [Neptuniibacter sp.]|uniref:tRNA (guanosine(18)-2'-O)-methyltransferase TrmH n=1 Tax=Neptuniibacter sp. TaxID=1962643 RepID=UPI002635DD44|nr:tRNA (guanosine(18)-2'-O)-methyltransferase TrmH [Neptuniibacter sp.]MCP4598578.1 tRNA (guanosine(18)-2'-O)-methyltransferase TrmH [Neptuniibacter sp.]